MNLKCLLVAISGYMIFRALKDHGGIADDEYGALTTPTPVEPVRPAPTLISPAIPSFWRRTVAKAASITPRHAEYVGVKAPQVATTLPSLAVPQVSPQKPEKVYVPDVEETKAYESGKVRVKAMMSDKEYLSQLSFERAQSKIRDAANELLNHLSTVTAGLDGIQKKLQEIEFKASFFPEGSSERWNAEIQALKTKRTIAGAIWEIHSDTDYFYKQTEKEIQNTLSDIANFMKTKSDDQSIKHLELKLRGLRDGLASTFGFIADPQPKQKIAEFKRLDAEISLRGGNMPIPME